MLDYPHPMSFRLWKFIHIRPDVFAIRWVAQCGHWVPVIVKMSEAYNLEDENFK